MSWRKRIAGLIRARRVTDVRGRLLDAQFAEDALFAERERAQVTLDSIGDAVATADFRGDLVYLNKAAERLVGDSEDSCRGRPMGEVFRLVDAVSGEPVGNPAIEAIIENQRQTAGANCLLLRTDGTYVPVDISASPIHDRAGGIVGAVLVAHDVTAARELADKMARLALYDHLTGLPNRTLFADRLDQAIGLAERTRTSFSLLYIDIDYFKEVNDTRGHEAGDELLKIAAERLRLCVRDSDTVSRQGGDEFLAILMHCAAPSAAATCAQKIVNALGAPYELHGDVLHLSASVGIAMFPADAKDRLALIRAADAAMYEAKCAGRNTSRSYSLRPPTLEATIRPSKVYAVKRPARGLD